MTIKTISSMKRMIHIAIPSFLLVVLVARAQKPFSTAVLSVVTLYPSLLAEVSLIVIVVESPPKGCTESLA